MPPSHDSSPPSATEFGFDPLGLDRHQLETLWSEWLSLDDHTMPGLVTRFREAIQAADRLGEVDLGVRLRLALVTIAFDQGQYPEALNAFAWAEAKLAANPELESQHPIMPHLVRLSHALCLSALSDYPTIPRDRIEAVYGELARRLERLGEDHGLLYWLRCFTELDMLNHDAARHAFATWNRHTHADVLDDPTCSAYLRVYYYAELGEDAKAFDEAQRVFEAQGAHHSLRPHTIGRLLEPLRRQGRLAEAARLQAEGLRLIETRRAGDARLPLALHLAFLTRTDQLARAYALDRTYGRSVIEQGSPWQRYHYLCSSAMLWRHLAETGRLREIEAATQGDASPGLPQSPESPAERAARLSASSRALALAFDRREGHHRFLEHWTATVEQPPTITPIEPR